MSGRKWCFQTVHATRIPITFRAHGNRRIRSRRQRPEERRVQLECVPPFAILLLVRLGQFHKMATPRRASNLRALWEGSSVWLWEPRAQCRKKYIYAVSYLCNLTVSNLVLEIVDEGLLPNGQHPVLGTTLEDAGYDAAILGNSIGKFQWLISSLYRSEVQIPFSSFVVNAVLVSKELSFLCFCQIVQVNLRPAVIHGAVVCTVWEWMIIFLHSW